MSRPRPDLRRRDRLAAVLALAAATVVPPLAAQSLRTLPENAEAGRLRIGVFPEAVLDGKPVLLGPGTRIYDAENRIVPPGQVEGERTVAYVRGQIGEVVQVWLLTDAEYRALVARISAARRAAGQQR
ncbi:MAG: hypothetical protein WCK28_14510 [Burkholderiales bacterium]|jgi:hypothetical protein